MRKILAYIFIAIILSGIFSFPVDVSAQPSNDPGTCTTTDTTDRRIVPNNAKTRGECTALNSGALRAVFTPADGTRSVNPGVVCTAPNTPVGCDPTAVTSGSAFHNNISDCKVLTGDFDDCLVKVIYYLFYVIPSWILNLIANFFNVIVAIALSSSIYAGSFIAESWKVVRDFSNIFFILILIYVAVQTILGIGHGTKKMIAQVIIMALLINFSMFFTKVVIDSSNILALIFYNKLKVEESVTKNGVVEKRAYAPMVGSDGVQDKDLSGGLVSRFDVTTLMTEEFFEKVRQRSTVAPTLTGAGAYIGTGAAIGSFIPVVGTGAGAIIGGVTYALSFVPSEEVPPGIMIGIILTAGFILIFAAYAFFVASWSFLGRILELWVLIIFSPFAFMSWAVHGLDHMEYIGWASWIKRLLKTAFMAPIFMFFMYFIFKIAQADIWKNVAIRPAQDQGMIETLIFLLLPALILLGLLKQATKFAKEGGGQLGEALIKGAGWATGLAVGGGIGLTASALQGGLGKVGKKMFENEKLGEWETSEDSRMKRFFGSRLRTLGGGDDGKGGLAGSSFDARRGVVGAGLKLVSGATGLNLGAESKFMMKEAGGYVADVERRENIRKKRAEGLKAAASGHATEELHHLEEEKVDLAIRLEPDLHKLDNDLQGWENKKKRYYRVKGYEAQYQEAADNVIRINNEKSKLKNGGEGAGGVYYTSNEHISETEYKDSAVNLRKATENKEAAEDILGRAEDTLREKQAEERTAKAIAEQARLNAESDPSNVSFAQALKNATDVEKEATKEATKATKDFAEAQKNNNIAQAVLDKAQENRRNAEEGERRRIAAGADYGKSINELDDKFIPHAKYEKKKAEHEAAWRYADRLEESAWGNGWIGNRDEIHESAHNIRMGAKPESHGKDHSHGVGDEILASVVAEALVGGHGGDHGGGAHGGGDHGGGAHGGGDHH